MRLKSIHTCESLGITEGLGCSSNRGFRTPVGGVVTRTTRSTFFVQWDDRTSPSKYTLTGVNPGCLKRISFDQPETALENEAQEAEEDEMF